ncbi:MAG: transposase, partial [Deltaproteobacteria bacterium]|nr:transposase [Deltaproteobacteria bacterium]
MNRYEKRPRLKRFSYKGRHQYFITICTLNKHSTFSNEDPVMCCLKILKEKSQVMNFKVWAYCFMPDHLHLLLEGKSEDADLKGFISSFKQASGYHYRLNVAQGFSPVDMPKLWQPSFYDHVLRENEDLPAVV